MNKKQKTEKCREILYKYSVNSIITDLDDNLFLISIFECHPEWDLKKGKGIKSISVVKNQFNKCFQLNRVDGSFTDISFTHSISNRSKLHEIKAACREAIRGLVVEFRDKNVIFNTSLCPITGDVLTKDNTHIDHYDMTFDEMFKLWIVKYNLESLYSKINDTEDNSVITYFTDIDIQDDFRKFHDENCKLRAVSKRANLSILKK